MADDQSEHSRQAANPSGRGPQTQIQDQQRGPDQQRSDTDSRRQRLRASPKRKRMVRFIVLALVVVGIIAAIPVWAYYSSRESTDDAQVDGHIVPISPRINGTVIEVLVNDNETVRAGQQLVLLDPADYKVALAEAEAALATAQANTIESQVNVPITNINTGSQINTSTTQVNSYEAAVSSAQQAVDTARARLGVSQAALAQAEANYAKAQKDLTRYQDLVSKDEISRQDFDAAVAAAAANQAQVDSAKAEITASQHSLDQAVAELNQSKAQLQTALVQRRLSVDIRPRQQAVTEARFKQAQAQVQQREADLNQAKLNVGYTIIRAPVDGVVSRKTAEPGMQVTPGQQIMALVPLDNIWVTANYKETQLKNVRVGQRVEISVDTYGGRKYRGHVDSIAAASGARFSLLPPENATGNYVKVVQRIPVKIILEPGENRDHSLRPGMSVEPTILLNSGTNNAY
ncbi:MAG: HlyD family secretion protein [Acidobacteriaceae bacterium]|nr:HlyD family secretion protein [Acidobacteriaceae bacterium]MBV8573179.1 HlyD family secretion protein [Acidobacteriaceae bacterium]